MNDVFLCLGGNIGHRTAALKAATHQIAKSCGRIVRASSLYESPAWGYQSANRFLNQVVWIKTTHTPTNLLKTLKKIEKAAGRQKRGTEYADRLIDIDILFYGNVVMAGKTLQLPHPKLHERRFVLKPLSEIAPDYVHPVLNKTTSYLLRHCPDKSRVSKFNSPVQPYISIEGNIGAGKTTLAKQLAKKLGAKYIAEQFEEIKLLPQFYKDPTRYAAALEKSFLVNRYRLLKKGLRTKPQTTVVSDFSIYRSAWFARVNLNAKDYKLFENVFSSRQRKLREPDLVVYLEAPAPLLKANIRKRGRPYEQRIEPNYLTQLSKSYQLGLKQLQGHVVLHIRVNKYGPKELETWLKRIEKIVIELFG